jgi:hypothetical protein
VGRAAYWRKQKGHAPRRTLNKQSLQDQVIVKLIPQICINKACSSRRLTVSGGEMQPQIDIHKAVSRLFFVVVLFIL